MLLLTSTSDKIRLVTNAAVDVDVHASWVDITGSPAVATPGRTNSKIVTATTTDIVASPAASTIRNVKQLHIANVHASSSVLVTVNHTDGTNVIKLHEVTLLAGERSSFVEGVGFRVFDVNGVERVTTPKLDAKLRVVSDVVNATTSFADVTGLTQNLLSGKKYAFECHLYHQTNATTTGAQFGVNIGAAPTVLDLCAIQQITSSVTAAAYGSSAMVTARDTAAVVETTGPGAVNMLAILSGFIQPSADGTFAIRCASEVAVASGLTVKAGSWLRIWEVDN